jgi:hypothetical protein
MLLLAMFTACAIAPSARAWSAKEHAQFARMAAERIVADPSTPPALKDWLTRATPGMLDVAGEKDFFLHTRVYPAKLHFQGITEWATVPDEHALHDRASSKVDPFGVHEKQLHFIDLELLRPPAEKKGYRPDLSGKPTLESIPRDMRDPRYIQAGMLPFRVQYCYDRLVECIRAGRLVNTEQKLEGEDDSAARWAGYLAHYLADNTQPQHATVDYKSATYFPLNHRPPNVHAEIEYRMCDDEKQDCPELRAEFWPLFVDSLKTVKDPSDTDDLFTATLQIALYSYDALPMIGDAAVAAFVAPPGAGSGGEIDTERFFHTRGTFHGQEMSVMQMKADQTAMAVLRIEKIWRRAWEEANRRKSE